MRLKRLFAISAVVVGSMVGFATPPASADTVPLCEQVWLRGYPIIDPTDAGQCFAVNAGFCDFQGVYSGIGVNVFVLACLPEPVLNP